MWGLAATLTERAPKYTFIGAQAYLSKKKRHLFYRIVCIWLASKYAKKKQE